MFTFGRHAVFLERHWCKLVKDMRNGSLDPHLPITEGKRTRVEVRTGKRLLRKIVHCPPRMSAWNRFASTVLIDRPPLPQISCPPTPKDSSHSVDCSVPILEHKARGASVFFCATYCVARARAAFPSTITFDYLCEIAAKENTLST